MYLSDRNLAYGEENTAEPKRKRKQKITVSSSFKSNGSPYHKNESN